MNLWGVHQGLGGKRSTQDWETGITVFPEAIDQFLPLSKKRIRFLFLREINYSPPTSIFSLFSTAKPTFGSSRSCSLELFRIWEYFVHSLPSHCALDIGRSSLSSSHARGKEPADPHTRAGHPASLPAALPPIYSKSRQGPRELWQDSFPPHNSHPRPGVLFGHPGLGMAPGNAVATLVTCLLPSPSRSQQQAPPPSQQPQLENLSRAPSSQPFGSRKHFNFHRKGSI